MSEAGWKWFAGSNDEHYTVGPCETRDEALMLAGDEDWDVIYLVEARQDPVDMSKMIDGPDIYERWLEDDEELFDEDGRCCVDVKEHQLKDLSEMLVMAVRHWQAKHAIAPVKYLFSATRNYEEIITGKGDDNNV